MAKKSPTPAKNGVQIPIIHVAQDGTRLKSPQACTPEAFCQADPCIEIGIFYLEGFQGGKFESVHVLALLDTGADGVYVDYSLINHFGCPIAPGGHDMMVNSTEKSTAHIAFLHILQNNNVFSLFVHGKDFGKENRPFKIELGRRFLQFCDLVYSGANQKVTLSYNGIWPGAW